MHVGAGSSAEFPQQQQGGLDKDEGFPLRYSYSVLQKKTHAIRKIRMSIIDTTCENPPPPPDFASGTYYMIRTYLASAQGKRFVP